MAYVVDANAEGKGEAAAADLEQLKTAVRHAIDNTNATKAKLAQGIIDMEEGGSEEVAEARVKAIEADFSAFLDSKKKMERDFAKALKCKETVQTKLREACTRHKELQSMTIPEVALALSKLTAVITAGFSTMETRFSAMEQQVKNLAHQVERLEAANPAGGGAPAAEEKEEEPAEDEHRGHYLYQPRLLGLGVGGVRPLIDDY